jgi:4-methyl-5(b-hydroxyethyl)-thiazole monophosphate biosynthesis
MNKRVLCLLVDGFEEIETITPVDLLRRAGVEVVIAGLHGASATGRSGIRLVADAVLEVVADSDFDLLLIPGGPGVGDLRRDGRAAALAGVFANNGKLIAAICAAPLVLMDAGLLHGRRFTAHQSVRDVLAQALDEEVVIDGNLITSRGAGTAMEFGLALVSSLAGHAVADKVAADIMV